MERYAQQMHGDLGGHWQFDENLKTGVITVRCVIGLGRTARYACAAVSSDAVRGNLVATLKEAIDRVAEELRPGPRVWDPWDLPDETGHSIEHRWRLKLAREPLGCSWVLSGTKDGVLRITGSRCGRELTVVVPYRFSAEEIPRVWGEIQRAVNNVAARLDPERSVRPRWMGRGRRHLSAEHP